MGYTQGLCHEFEGGGVNALEGGRGAVNTVKTLKFEKDREVHDPPPAPMLAPPTHGYIANL